MTAKILTKYVWNGREYCNIQYSDGTCVTLKGDIGQYTDEQWIQKALDLAAAQPDDPDPMTQIIRSCTDQELVDEVIRRRLVVTAQGEVL